MPLELGFFDEGGVPKTVLERRSFVELRRSLEDFDLLVGEIFPEGISDAQREDLRREWQTVRLRPWSPQAMIDALLADWPENETVRDVSWEATEKMVAEACERGIAELEAKKHRKPRGAG